MSSTNLTDTTTAPERVDITTPSPPPPPPSTSTDSPPPPPPSSTASSPSTAAPDEATLAQLSRAGLLAEVQRQRARNADQRREAAIDSRMARLRCELEQLQEWLRHQTELQELQARHETELEELQARHRVEMKTAQNATIRAKTEVLDLRRDVGEREGAGKRG